MRKINASKIMKVAETWLGTRFHYYGRVRKNDHNRGGIDCIGLIMKIGEEIGSTHNGKNIINYDYFTYSRLPNQGELQSFLDKYFIEIDKKQVKVGDLVYMNFDNNLEHIALITDRGIMHCYIEAGGVVEHHLSDEWKDKIKSYYRYPKN